MTAEAERAFPLQYDGQPAGLAHRVEFRRWAPGTQHALAFTMVKASNFGPAP